VSVANELSGMISLERAGDAAGAAGSLAARGSTNPVWQTEGSLLMCTYITEKIAIEGSAKGASGWIKVTDGTVYLDHPVHAPFGHTLNIDFLAPELGPSGRVAVELSQESARALAKAITAILDAAPPGLE
jgi:hypothetical protein